MSVSFGSCYSISKLYNLANQKETFEMIVLKSGDDIIHSVKIYPTIHVFAQ